MFHIPTPAMLSLPQLQALSTVPQLLMPPLLFQLPMPLPQPTPMVSTTFTTLANVRPKLIHNTYTMVITLLVLMVPTFTTPLVFTALTHTALTVMPIILANVMPIPNTTPPTHIPDSHTTTMFTTPLESTVHPFTTPLVFTAEMSTTTFMEDGIKRMNVSPQK